MTIETKPKEESKYLTIDELCVYWKISESTAFRLIKQGLPSVKVLGSRRILRDAADRWLLAGGGRRRKPRKPKTPPVQVFNNTEQFQAADNLIAEGGEEKNN